MKNRPGLNHFTLKGKIGHPSHDGRGTASHLLTRGPGEGTMRKKKGPTGKDDSKRGKRPNLPRSSKRHLFLRRWENRKGGEQNLEKNRDL